MKIDINISDILMQAGKIVWKFKVLWIFGILASFGSGGNGGNYNGGSSGGGDPTGTDLPEPLRKFFGSDLNEVMTNFFKDYLIIIIVVVSLMCLLTLLFYFLGVVGKTGLIKGAHKADLGADRLGFGELWGESTPYFWRVFGLGLVIGLPFFLIVVVLVVILMLGIMAGGSSNDMSGALLASLGIFVPAICCVGLAAMLVGVVVEQARIAMVIENLGVFESLRRGWNVFKGNFLAVIVMSIILGIMSGVVGTIVALPMLLALAPLVALAFVSSSDSAAVFTPILISGLCCVAYLPILLVLQGIIEAYTQSAMTLTYLRLTTTSAPPQEPINA